MTQQAIIKADAGWFLCVPLWKYAPKRFSGIYETEIIAWQIDYSTDINGEAVTSVEPITLCGFTIDDIGFAIYRTPEGQYKEPVGEVFVSRDHALTRMKKRLEELGEAV